MKASEVEKGAVLLWQRRKWGSGDRVRVVDPRPVFGRTSPYSQNVAEGHGTGVLVEVLQGRTVIRRDAAQLRALIGPYDAVVKQRRAEERAAEKARQEREAERKRTDARLEALQRKTRRVLGVTVYGKNDHPWTPKIVVNADVFAGLVELADKHGWKPDTETAKAAEDD